MVKTYLSEQINFNFGDKIKKDNQIITSYDSNMQMSCTFLYKLKLTIGYIYDWIQIGNKHYIGSASVDYAYHAIILYECQSEQQGVTPLWKA